MKNIVKMAERAVSLDPTKHVTVSQVIVETDVKIVSIFLMTRRVFELKKKSIPDTET